MFFMKKSLRLAAAIALGLGMQLSAVTGVSAGNGTGISDFVADYCAPRVESGQFKNVGQCVGNSRQELVQYCKDNFSAMAFRNHGSCEKWAADVVKAKNY
jgi:hypothetical protein